MNDMTRIEWADVSKGMVINDQLYCPRETPPDKVKCAMCDYLMTGKCNGKTPCITFGENVYLRYVGKVVGIFVEPKERRRSLP